MGFFEVFAAPLAGFFAVIPSYGLAIILLTLAVRLLLLPLSIKQTRSMREMQRIQPEVKKLQAKYKGNRQKLNEEMMALYKEHGVNPFGGCLPLLMQLPVFIALYRVISRPLAYMGYKAVGEGAALHWVADAASKVPDAIKDSALAHGLLTNPIDVQRFLGIRLDCSPSNVISQAPTDAGPLLSSCHQGLAGAIPFLALVVLMGFTTYYQQKQMQGTRGASDPAAQQMQMMGKIMPVMLMFFSFSFPAGLTLYWLTTNLWTIGQQRLMLNIAPPPTPPGKKAGGGGSPKKPAPAAEAKKLPKGGRPATKGAQASSGKTKGSGKSTPAATAGRNKKKR